MVELNTVRRDAPWAWLKAGFADLKRAPGVSLSYGLIFVGLGLMINYGLNAIGAAAVIPVAMSGFALIAPALAVGVYQISRALERGEKPRFRVVVSRYPSRISQLAFLSLLLALLLMAWFRIAQLLLAMIAANAPMDPNEFVFFSLNDAAGITLFVVGTIVGAVLAMVAFMISAVSFPMLVDQDVDAITAMAASWKAVTTQPFVMITWALIIAMMTIAGSALFLIGLAITFPWIAHATWYCYKDFAPRATQGASAAA